MNEKPIFYLISSYVKLFFCGNHIHAFMKIEQHCYIENVVDVKWMHMKMHNLQFMILYMTITVKRRENLSNISSCTYVFYERTIVFTNKKIHKHIQVIRLVPFKDFFHLFPDPSIAIDN